MTDPALPFRVVALYRFTPLDVVAVRPPLLALCEAEGVCGTLLLAPEGINGTIAGDDGAIDAVLAHICALPGCDDLEVRESRCAERPFHRMKVRPKREIVTMGEPTIDPTATGAYVLPADWNALITDPATVVVDTRNDYEVAIGSFDGAIDPATPSFRDFPAWFRANREQLEGKTVAMFCTGGIRCEKATALLKAEGIADVRHLKGGILGYLESVPPAESLWHGECFVFDERVAVGHGLTQGSHSLCHGCRMPVSPEQRASPHYVEGVSCPACHNARDAETQARYAERARQVKLAEARGERHVGARYPND
ncbi:oxygen-dependent tRNA uridine(34) hydroxylase TrhO [Sphingomonas sp. RS2018]